MPLLWWLLIIPVGFICLGALVHVIGGEKTHFEVSGHRQILGSICGLAASGFWSAILLCIVAVPVLVLRIVFHLSYDASTLAGIPLGLVMAGIALHRTVRNIPVSNKPDLEHEAIEQSVYQNKHENE